MGPHAAYKKMIKSIKVENFRCFKKLELLDLGKFNIIVGDNGSGKTTLLEAIFLPANGPQVPQIFRGLRGMANQGFSSEKEQYESLYSDLFFGLAVDSQIKIDLIGSPENARSARLFYAAASEMPLFPEENANSVKMADRIFTLESTDANNNMSVTKLNLDGNLTIAGFCKVQKSGYAASVGTSVARETAQRLSDIKRNSVDEFQLMVETIQSLFPEITDPTVLLTGGTGEVFCKVQGIPKVIPVSLASNGLNKILNYLLLFPGQRNGVVLIDEIENGIYYKRYPKLWEALIAFSKQFGNQLFVTTHSKECLDALIPSIEQEKEEFRLIRTECNKDGSHDVKMFNGKNLVAALETGTEIRG
jgi:hypothetical protein